MKRALVTSILPFVLAACGSAPPDEMLNPNNNGCDAKEYVCSQNFGYTAGTTIANLKLVGKRDDNKSGSPTDDAIRTISLSDYYKDKGIKALVVTVAAEWCVPCRAEQPGLITMYNEYKAAGAGVAIVEAMIQDKLGKPATMEIADRWANTAWGPQQLKIPFDMATDPTVVLGPYYNIAAFPMQMVIRTSDMQITYQNNGAGEQAEAQLKAAVDSVLGN